MPIAATLLFGSLARADQSEGSDTDLLMIGLDEETRHVSIGNLSLFLYPWRQIDPDNYLPRLRQVFQFRSSYAAEISRASDFGWFLVSFGAELNPQLLTKRALWCVRTILIARSAEERNPVFAPERLAERAQSLSAQDLLRNRRGSRDDIAVRNALRQFLIDARLNDRSLEHADRAEFIDRFKATTNKVALQTLRQEENSEASYMA
jgi:predicted nucleotidyltransferase